MNTPSTKSNICFHYVTLEAVAGIANDVTLEVVAVCTFPKRKTDQGRL